MLEARFYETYYFCNIIRNVLSDQMSFMRNLNDFYGDEKILYLISPFEKYSAFHVFIEYVIDEVYFEQLTSEDIERRCDLLEQYRNIPAALADIRPLQLPVEKALDFHGIEHVSFQEYLRTCFKSFKDASEDDLYEYIAELRFNGSYEKLMQHTAKEVFHVLFQNRALLMVFNDMLASALQMSDMRGGDHDFSKLLSSRGTLKRVSIPKWVKRAVFFRDRGRCVLCDKDLSGLINLGNYENYDHMVPLARYGLNDVSNIQLLCKECNQVVKKANGAATSNKYQSWYLYD